MKYDHDNEHTIESLGISEEEYDRITDLISKMCNEPGANRISRFVEAIEPTVENDMLLRRFIIFLATRELANQSSRNSPDMLPIPVVEAILSKVTGEDMKGKVQIILDNCSNNCENDEGCINKCSENEEDYECAEEIIGDGKKVH